MVPCGVLGHKVQQRPQLQQEYEPRHDLGFSLDPDITMAPVAAQTIQTNMASVAAWPKDTNMASGD